MFGDQGGFNVRTLRFAVLAGLAVGLFTTFGGGAGPARPKAPTPDQQVAELVGAYRDLPEAAKFEAEGDRVIERLHMVRGKLSPRSREAVSRLEASTSSDRSCGRYGRTTGEPEACVSKRREREVLAERLSAAVPHLEPLGGKWQHKVLSESYVEKLGEGDLATGLDQLGEKGWELVGFEKGRFVFKRER